MICIMLRRLGAALGLALALAFTTAAPAQPANWNSAVWFQREVGSGITWRYYQFNSLFNAKQSVSYVEIDLNNPGVNLKIPFRNSYVGPSPGVSSPDFPRAPTSTMAPTVPNARAAINGTYFNVNSYDPANPTVPWGGGNTFLRVDGTTIHTFDGTSVNRYLQGLLFNNTGDVTIMRKSGGWINRVGSWQNMMISGPILIDNGVLETYAADNDHANARHPRTAVGKVSATNKLILLTVDGRTGEAAGMSCTELALVMQAIGCDYAMNLDGGGSTTLWVSGEPFNGVVNYPSDNGAYDHLGERGCANAVVVASAPATPAAWDGRFGNINYNTLTRSGEALPVTITVTNIGTETWTTPTVSVVPSRAFGRTSPFIPPAQLGSHFSMNPETVAPGQVATFTLNLTPPTVASDTFYEENFALWHQTNGYFGPPDNKMKVRLTVRPPMTGAPATMIVQGTPTGPNNQWYVEPSGGGWANSSVGFTAAGVNNSGTQRYAGSSTAGRYADFKPIFDVPGVYRVDAAYPASSNNIPSVQYKVNHLGGTNSFTLSQSTGANTWHTLGQFAFGTGSSGGLGVHSVRVTNDTVPATGNRFYSGAIRFDYVGPLAPELTSISLSDLDGANSPSAGFTNSPTVKVEFVGTGTIDTIELSEVSNFIPNVSVPVTGADITYTFANTTDGVKTLYARLRNTGGVSTSRSNTIQLDATPPSAMASSPATKVGGDINGTYSAGDTGGSGLREVVLHARKDASAWASAGTVTGGTFATVPAAGDGEYFFHAVATDNAGNVSPVPLDDSDPGQASTLYNEVPNSDFTRAVATEPSVALLFPMKDGGVNVQVTLAGVTAPGTLTVSRTENNTNGASIDPATLIGQRWTITPAGGLAFGSATLMFTYEESLLNSLPESAITAAYEVDGTAFTMHACMVDTTANTATVTGVTSFSDWYLGNSTARVGDWTLY